MEAWHRPSAARQAAVIVASLGAAVAVRAAIDPWVGNNLPYLTFFPAVAFAGYFGGLRTGVVTAVLGGLLADFLFVSPRYHLLIDQPGGWIGLVGYIGGAGAICVLIHARGQALRALRERSEEMAAAVERMPALVWMAHDAECRRVTGNAAAAEFFGVDPGANVSQSAGAQPAVPVRHLDASGRELKPEELPIQRAAATGQAVKDVELQLELSGGRRAWIRGNATPLFSSDGKVRGVLSTFLDVSARKKAEAELQASQERLGLAQRAARMGTWEWNIPTGKVVWSDEVCVLHGIPPGSFDGTFEGWRRTVHPDDRARAEAAVADAVARGGAYENEYRTVMPDGSVAWTVARGQFFNDESGKPARLLGVCMDITEQKRGAETLREAERLAATGRMAATLAHEINNPLAAIVNLSYLLRQDARLAPELEKYAAMLDEELRRISQIVRQTLNLYREDSGAGTEVAVEKVVDSVLQIYAGPLLDIQVSAECEPGCLVRSQESELHQLLANLVLNAAEAAPRPGGRVRIRARRGREWGATGRTGVRVVVADSGGGIEPAIQGRIFEPFFTTKKEKGSGLGLAVVQWVAGKHGGTVRLRSSTRPGRSGTCVAVFLPAAEKRRAAAGGAELRAHAS